MLPFRKILFPVDYSDACEAIVPWVAAAARENSADLVLLHAYGAEALAETSLRLTDPSLFDEVRAIQEVKLSKFGTKHFPELEFEAVAKLGEAAVTIHDTVKSHGADLIMMPTHGHGAVRRMLMGSVTAKVLHDFDGAVWTASPEAIQAGPVLPYHSIVCALDEGEEAEAVLRAAIAIRKDGTELSAVHAIETPPMSAEFDFTPYRKQISAESRKQMRLLLEKLGMEIPHRVLDGAPVDAVCGEARRLKANLIITGRGRMRGVLGQLWSHVYGIVREAPCPVLSV